MHPTGRRFEGGAPPPDTAVSTAAFDGYELSTALDELARLGVRTVELAYIRGYSDFTEDVFGAAHARSVRRLLEDRGLRARSVSAHVNLGLADARGLMARRIGFAEAIGAGILISNAAPRALRDAFLVFRL